MLTEIGGPRAIDGYQALAARHQRAVGDAAQFAADPVPQQLRRRALRAEASTSGPAPCCTRSTRLYTAASSPRMRHRAARSRSCSCSTRRRSPHPRPSGPRSCRCSQSTPMRRASRPPRRSRSGGSVHDARRASELRSRSRCLQTVLRVVGQVVDLLEDAKDLLTGEDTRQAIIADLGGNPFTGRRRLNFRRPGLESVKAYRDAAEPDLEGLFAADPGRARDGRRAALLRRALGSGDGRRPPTKAFARCSTCWRSTSSGCARRGSITSCRHSASPKTSARSTGRVRRASRACCARYAASATFFSTSATGAARAIRRRGGRAPDLRSNAVAVAALTAYGLKIPVPSSICRRPRPTTCCTAGTSFPACPAATRPTAVDRALARTLTLKFADTAHRSHNREATTRGTSLTSLALVPRTQGGPGLFVSLGGGCEVDGEISAPWHLSSHDARRQRGQFHPAARQGRRFKFNGPAVGGDFRGGLALEARPDPITNKAFDIRFAKGTGISAGLLRFEIGGHEQDFAIKTVVRNGVLSLGKIFDGFLDRLIPADGVRLAVDFAVGLSSKRGRFLEGQVRSVGAGGHALNSPGVTAAAGWRCVPPPLPPLPQPESTGPGVSMRHPDRQVARSVDHSRRPVARRSGGVVRRSRVSARGGHLAQHEARAGAWRESIASACGSRSGCPEDPSDGNLGFFDLDVGAKPPEGVGLAIDAKGVAHRRRVPVPRLARSSSTPA